MRCALTLAMSVMVVSGCAKPPPATQHTTVAATAKLQAVNLNDSVKPIPHDQPVVLSTARNESASFAIQASELSSAAGVTLRINAPQLESASGTISAGSFEVAQILAMPVDVNRAGYVRHTGLSVSDHPLPRALLPVRLNNGNVELPAFRDPAQPTSVTAKFTGTTQRPLLVWVDLHVPSHATPGEYACNLDLVAAGSERPIASLPLKLTVHDFTLPDQRQMLMVSRLDWDQLKRLYPDEFETVTPRLLSRKDERCAASIRTLDAIQRLAQSHRTQIVIPRLQPTVKWQLGKPRIDWDDLDSVLTPWLDGAAFADRVALGYWPMPSVDFLDRFDRASQLEYWGQAAAHFEQKNWIDKTAVWIDNLSPGRPSSSESIELSAQASEVLNVHPKLRVTLPLEMDRVQLAGPRNETFVQPKSTERLIAEAPGIVFASPIKPWPTDATRPQHWLRTDLPGLVPYVGGGGDERDVRVWSFLAFLRNAGMIVWGSPLPRTNSPQELADPNDLFWFYPGSWFGVEEPVPTIQLKWLRRAQQDFEYLHLARQRGEAVNATLMARLLTKPVEIQPGQNPDPTYALMSGTADQNTWNEAHRILANLILLRQQGQTVNNVRRDELGFQILRWCAPQEQPFLLARQVQWQIDRPPTGIPGNWLSVRLGIDIYNASDMKPEQNLLQWTAMPRGWEVRPKPTGIPALATYRVQRYMMDARYNLNAIDAKDKHPVQLTFTNGFNRQDTIMKTVLPVRPSDRHVPGLQLDGRLDDWSEADAIQAGPMIRMFNRPALQKHQVQYAGNPAAIFTGWHDDNFYVSFKLDGVSTRDLNQSRNFVDYEFRRAWGEDLCEILIQPLFSDNTVGPVLHVVCKPTGHWVERKLDPRLHADPWQPLEGAAIRYCAKMDPNGGGSTTWRGEVAIPWKAITDRSRGIPPFLRFNFVQHNYATGESASWAGPIDYGRDDALMGLLHLREPNDPGMGIAGQSPAR